MNTLIPVLQKIFRPEHVLVDPEARAAFARDALRPHRGFADMTVVE